MLKYMPSTAEPSLNEAPGLSEEELARVLKALADPSRLCIFNMLMEGVQCNCEIARNLGFSLSLISHHLRVLHEVGLVQSERDDHDARWIYHSVDRRRLAQHGRYTRITFDYYNTPALLPRPGVYLGRGVSGIYRHTHNRKLHPGCCRECFVKQPCELLPHWLP